jgi:hypothetical protein
LFEVQIFHVGRARDAETEWAAKRVAKLHHAVGDWGGWAHAIAQQRPDVEFANVLSHGPSLDLASDPRGGSLMLPLTSLGLDWFLLARGKRGNGRRGKAFW